MKEKEAQDCQIIIKIHMIVRKEENGRNADKTN
jgi:hypothetical protein